MSQEHPPLAIELLSWIADQQAPITEPVPADQPDSHPTRYPEDFAYLADVPDRFWTNAKSLLTYLDGKGWVVVRVFDPTREDPDTPDHFSKKFSPLQESDAFHKWKQLLAKTRNIRETLEQLPDSGPVHIDNATDEIVPEAGPNTRTVSAAAVRNGMVRLRDVQLYLTPEGRTTLAEASLAGPSESERPPDTVRAADAKLAGSSPLDSFEDPVPVSWVAQQVGQRSDKIAEKMSRRQYPVLKVGNRNYCERAHAMAMFPRARKHLTANHDEKN